MFFLKLDDIYNTIKSFSQGILTIFDTFAQKCVITEMNGLFSCCYNNEITLLMFSEHFKTK